MITEILRGSQGGFARAGEILRGPLADLCDVHYQRVVPGPALGLKNPLNGLGVQGVGRKAVYRLGGYGN